MTVKDLEQEVYDLDEIRIVVRTSRDLDVGDYDYERKAADNTSITEWLDQRIYPLFGQNRVRVEVVDGYGALPHGRTRLSVVRGSYAR
jgi:hypothetical protein